ncbi:deoxyguanosinetriphosphate triphosphohydrolase [Jatrophihabitans sp. YIM 134969]
MTVPSYDDAARARLVAEPAKRGAVGEREQRRSPFARDRARILHSHGFRRLADKTQVVAPGEDDFPRTRLTHSLEVAQIAREMGEAVGVDPDVVDAAGLAHDLGHPPFGHNGEDALDVVAAAIGGFEGNAQTFRVLTRLEARVEGAGLNLTRAVLDAASKYPWQRQAGRRKFGVYADDLPAFEWMRAGAPDGARCAEAAVMDWADDVAYSVHDLEDGVHSGLIRLDTLTLADRQELCRLAAAHFLDGVSVLDLEPVLDRLLALPALVDLAGVGRSFGALSAAKRATSELTGRFVGAAVAASSHELTRYTGTFEVPSDIVAECALLKAVALRYVMQRPEVEPLKADERRLLVELVELLVTRGPDGVAPALRPAWEAASDDGRLRLVVDQVATMTDSAARATHARLLATP